MHNYRELKIWQRTIDLAVSVTALTKRFPKEETYGISSQLRRSSVSIASNIAEGAYRNSNKEFLHFLGIANGSAAEVDTQLMIAQKLDYITLEEYNELWNELDHIQRMNFNFQDKLRQEIK